MPSPKASKEEKMKIIEETCGKCGYYKDALARREAAIKTDKPWRKLVCIHPKNAVAYAKWKPHITDWAKTVKRT